ncbi:N-6 DNA methylase [Streptomyces durocortorensis]|uniref:N-6 DNA methylase n=1 Tax=Streptomyces durocortorensis TaxID=2811104 RepID=A0ABS2HV96_9ACTN|nr:N-6 DNA methylase [Streptomyces durocortorensis]MBM7054961.1 N-6 DNA methylase [Streptomyces durocortorensis]
MTERRRYEPVTLGEIKELAEVGRPTVSNWRRRHASFPEPVGGSESKPLFDAEEIGRWLDERPVPDGEPHPDGTLPTYGERFRDGLRSRRLVMLGHGMLGPDELIVRALAVVAMEGEGGGSAEESLPVSLLADFDAADTELLRTVRELIGELGSTGAAAEAVLKLAGRLQSDLAMDATPLPVVELIDVLAQPVLSAAKPVVVLNLCAGAGDVLLALDADDGENYVAAVEPDALRRTVLNYRLLAHWSAGEILVCPTPEDLDGVRLPPAHSAVSGSVRGPLGFPPADLVVADPPYASGEHERDEEGPLKWALEAVRRLGEDGQALVVVPSWTLSRPRGATGTANTRMREYLLKSGAVEAIIQLPRRIHTFRTGAEHALLVLRGTWRPPTNPHTLLIDADRLARRVGDAWQRNTVGLLGSTATPVPQEAQRVRVDTAGPGSSYLLDGRSLLPAHRLASPEKGLDHFAATVEARQNAYVALPHLKQWIGDLGVGKREVRAEHFKVGGQLRAGQLRLLPGHRIRESDIGDAGVPVIGREEMLGALPLGQRRIMLEELAAYPQTQMTEQGDVFLLTEHGVRTQVDDAGGCVLLAPVQGLRIAAYRKYLMDLAEGGTGRPGNLWMRPHALARLLAAPRNQQRGSGSLVRRVSVKDMDLPQLPVGEIADLDAVLAETERHRADVRRQLSALDTLAERLAAGVADGDLRLRKRPDRNSGP